MSYLGNLPVAGENNSFKILDDISTYTLTFNGSSSSIVSVANNRITQSNHRFITGQKVTYATTGTAIGGLTSGNTYYIIKDGVNTFKLASSYSNAINSVAIDITTLGIGSSHSINIAFDGFNNRFKATYDNGNAIEISRSSQLNISINGVIQKPNDIPNPSDGFGFDSDSVIVFSVPPVSTDVFWGNVLGNNFPTFDVADNTIDTFTGNGTQTIFALSKIVANSQNVLVTIGGTVQYPTDSTATREYSTFANSLTFTTAPTNGSIIQVRHIGYAGPTSSNVTGFYGRTGNVGLVTSDIITVSSVGIATTNSTSKLHVVGDAIIVGVITANDFNSTSDIKLKTNIQTIQDPLDKIMKLNGVSFNWRENNKPSLGVIAQEVEKVLPELINGDDPKTVNYNGLIGLLIECIKVQQQEINTLKEKL